MVLWDLEFSGHGTIINGSPLAVQLSQGSLPPMPTYGLDFPLVLAENGSMREPILWDIPGLDHHWNDEFVDPILPSLGQKVSLKLRVPKSLALKVHKIRIFGIRNGADTRWDMQILQEEGDRVWYEGVLTLEQPYLNYSFHIWLQDDQSLYYTRRGVSRFYQTENHDWVLMADYRFPAWIQSQVFYQIYPDRFANGDPTLSIKSDQYQFQGSGTKALEWDQEPLEYEEGRCLDFYGGDLVGIKEKIPYLKELGITALYLTPIFSAKTTHRYDCIDFFHVDPHLGGNQALADLSKALHDHQMKLMLDISINHTGVEHHWFKRAKEVPSAPEAEFYYRDQEGNFSFWMGAPTLPQLNYTNEKLREIMYKGEESVLKQYLKPPFSIDAWRFDVGNHTARKDKDQLGNEVFKEIREELKEQKDNLYIIGEHWEDSITYLQGDQWDGAMNYFMVSRALRRFFGEMDRFFYGEEHNTPHSPPLSGWDFVALVREHMDRLPPQTLNAQFNLINSHDVARLYLKTELLDHNQYRGALVFQFLLPGTPCIYYGEEVGVQGHGLTTEGIRYPMEWDPKKQDKARFGEYQRLIALKKKDAVLQKGFFVFLESTEKSVFFLREFRGEAYLGRLSRDPRPEDVELDFSSYGIKLLQEVLNGREIPLGDGVTRFNPEDALFKVDFS